MFFNIFSYVKESTGRSRSSSLTAARWRSPPARARVPRAGSTATRAARASRVRPACSAREPRRCVSCAGRAATRTPSGARSAGRAPAAATRWAWAAGPARSAGTPAAADSRVRCDLGPASVSSPALSQAGASRASTSCPPSPEATRPPASPQPPPPPRGRASRRPPRPRGRCLGPAASSEVWPTTAAGWRSSLATTGAGAGGCTHVTSLQPRTATNRNISQYFIII